MVKVRQMCVSGNDLIGVPLDEVEIDRLASVLKALAHPVRLRMVDLINRGGGDICVCEFEKHFELTQPTISHHLKILRDAGLIRSRQDGTWVRHAIEGEVFSRARRLLGALGAELEDA